MFKLTWPRAFVLMLFLAASVATFLWARDLGLQRQAAQERRAANLPRAFRLPPMGAGAATLLGHTRAEVRATLGTPVEMLPEADHFDVGVSLRFFYERDRASALIVRVEGARLNEAALRRWLGIGPGALQTLGDRRLRAGWLTEDGPDSFSLTIEPEWPEVKEALGDEPPTRRRAGATRDTPFAGQSPVRASKGIVRLAGELVRTFPAVPDVLRARCVERSRDGMTELACRDAVDALVDYQLADDGTWATLTILGPRGTDEKETCRGWLERHVPDAVAVGQRQRDDELQVYFARGPTRYLVSFLTLPRPGAGASCSLMACLEDDKGNGRDCRPR